MTVIIALLTIILVGISLNRGPLMDFNIIGASVSVLSIAVALVIGYQIINVLEIKSGMKNQNERIEKKHEEIQTVLDSKTREVDARMEVIRKELKAQKNQVDEQLQSIAKQEIVINQLLAKRSINKPYEYPEPMANRKTVWDAIGSLPEPGKPSDVAMRVAGTIKERREKYGY